MNWRRALPVLVGSLLLLGLWHVWDAWAQIPGWSWWHRVGLAVIAFCIVPGSVEWVFRVVQGWRR
jgi:hypothetical protein